MTDTRTIKALLVEDDAADATLIRGILADDADIQISLDHADRLSSAIAQLGEKVFDVILLDLTLPDSRGKETFDTLHAQFPETPIIVLTGLDDRELALHEVSKGAQDYILKGQISLSHLLSRAMLHAIERQKLLLELDRKMKEIKTLKGLIPMCAWCRKIRNEKGYWQSVEEYLAEQTDAAFTHGMCEACSEKATAEFHEIRKKKAAEHNTGGQ